MSPPEFTIICRTEGGPATTVSWYRPNGDRVQEGDSDHETSQIIVDTRNSVYENRLQVRGREAGTYFIRDYFPYLIYTTSKAPGNLCMLTNVQ